MQSGMNPTREWAIGELRRMVLEALGDREGEARARLPAGP